MDEQPVVAGAKISVLEGKDCRLGRTCAEVGIARDCRVRGADRLVLFLLAFDYA